MYAILNYNPQLRPYTAELTQRVTHFQAVKAALAPGGSLSQMANGHFYFGIHHHPEGWVYREWAPAAQQLWLTGEFNQWNPTSHPLRRLEGGVWELVLPGRESLWQGCAVKTLVQYQGAVTEHIPLYARYVTQDAENYLWCARVWEPEEPFPWHPFVPKEEPLLIYEAHVGMAQEKAGIGSYRAFADNTLPWIAQGGYNTVELMAIMEHPYYASFGYQVSNFFAPSSRFGTPEELKYLIDRAHQLGLRVLLDLVHSHAVGNQAEGIHKFDGTVWQFFHSGSRGDHPAWGTKLFDYGKHGVLHFLLSNVKYWLTEFHFDGFRFDGVTSMLYRDHGLGAPFDRDERYFGDNVDEDALTYLQLANDLIREVNPHAVTLAEDVSGMPGVGLPIDQGGLGFDARMGMGIPDLWGHLVKDVRDEDWDLDAIWSSFCLRRPGEKTIAYVECHDQSIVGDQAMLFRLAGERMYTEMSKTCHTPEIDRATALHKLMRLLTCAAGGDGYLNFMGNEFGHPEWVDFPRAGNGDSFQYCRRQWSLVQNPDLKYQSLARFDRAMLHLARQWDWFRQWMPDLKLVSRDQQVLAFERGNLIFVFNFSPTHSYPNALIPVSRGEDHVLLLSTDDETFGGQGRIAPIPYPACVAGHRGNYLQLYLPARTAVVLAPEALGNKIQAPQGH